MHIDTHVTFVTSRKRFHDRRTEGDIRIEARMHYAETTEEMPKLPLPLALISSFNGGTHVL
jgi:hypothetical protein